jgi:hypothetical protein
MRRESTHRDAVMPIKPSMAHPEQEQEDDQAERDPE